MFRISLRSSHRSYETITQTTTGKNPTDKAKKIPQGFSIGERLIHLEEILPLTVSNGVSRKQ